MTSVVEVLWTTSGLRSSYSIIELSNILHIRHRIILQILLLKLVLNDQTYESSKYICWGMLKWLMTVLCTK